MLGSMYGPIGPLWPHQFASSKPVGRCNITARGCWAGLLIASRFGVRLGIGMLAHTMRSSVSKARCGHNARAPLVQRPANSRRNRGVVWELSSARTTQLVEVSKTTGKLI